MTKSPPSVMQGPLTRARARQLNQEVSSFLCSSAYTGKDGMLPNDIIDYVIDKLCEYKYLDDSNYANSFVLTYSNKYGKLKLISMLKSKGIKDDIIEDIFAEKVNNNIEKVARKYIGKKELNSEIWSKLSRFLYSRGYEFDDINEYEKWLCGV